MYTVGFLISNLMSRKMKLSYAELNFLYFIFRSGYRVICSFPAKYWRTGWDCLLSWCGTREIVHQLSTKIHSMCVHIYQQLFNKHPDPYGRWEKNRLNLLPWNCVLFVRWHNIPSIFFVNRSPWNFEIIIYLHWMLKATLLIDDFHRLM